MRELYTCVLSFVATRGAGSSGVESRNRGGRV